MTDVFICENSHGISLLHNHLTFSVSERSVSTFYTVIAVYEHLKMHHHSVILTAKNVGSEIL